jgi:hypothetical protein
MILGLRHLAGVEELVELFFGEVGLLAGYLADGAAGLVGLFGDLGRPIVADLGRECGGEHEALFDELGAALGGVDTDHALVGCRR